MARKRAKAPGHGSEESHDKRTPKTVWHPLNLQRVPLGRFVDVVNQILNGKLALFEASLKDASSTRDLDESPTARSDPRSSKRK